MVPMLNMGKQDCRESLMHLPSAPLLQQAGHHGTPNQLPPPFKPAQQDGGESNIFPNEV